MKHDAMRQEQAYPDLGGLPYERIGRLLLAGWRTIRGADRPTYITVPVGRGLKAVLVVPSPVPARRRR